MTHFSFTKMVLGYLAATLLGCGGSVATSGGADTSVTDGGADGATTDTRVDEATVDAATTCFDPTTGAVPDSMRACTTRADCTIAKHQTDCCGTTIYMGLATSAVAAFSACEAPWDAHFPGCGCAGRSMADDGQIIGDPTKLALDCVLPSGGGAGRCRTSSCVAGQLCSPGTGCATGGCGGVSCSCDASGTYVCTPRPC